MPTRSRKIQRHPEAGFNLIVVSLLLTVLGIAMAAGMMGGGAGDTSTKTLGTIDKMQRIEKAELGFMAKNGRRPCPADGQYPQGNANFGIEAANSGACTGGTPAAPLSGAFITGATQANPIVITANNTFSAGNTIYISGIATGSMTQLNGNFCKVASSPAPTSTTFALTDTSGNNINGTSGYSAYVVGSGGTATMGPAVAGTVPTVTLGLPDEYGFDEWGHRITYVVDMRATSTNLCQNMYAAGTVGSVTVNDSTGSAFDYVVGALVAHGPDGHGAWPLQGSSSTLTSTQSVASRIDTFTTDANKLNNASQSSATGTSPTMSFDNIFVKGEPTPTFNDLLYYTQTYKNTCCLGTMCIPLGFRVDGTANGEKLGYYVATGDVNGDNITDLVISDSGGSVYVIFGTKTGFPNPLPITSLNGSNGFKITGTSAFGGLAVGDANGDGLADIVFSDSTSLYVIFGQNCGGPTLSACGFSSLTAASNIDGTHGYKITKVGTDRFGLSNGAYYRPIAIGNINGDLSSAGKALNDIAFSGTTLNILYVIFGQPCGGVSSGFPVCNASFSSMFACAAGTCTVDPTDHTHVTDGTHGLYINEPNINGSQQGSYANHYFGSLYNTNSSGIQDLVVSETQGAGQVNVIFGSSTPVTLAADNGGSLPLSNPQGASFYDNSASGWTSFGTDVAIGDLNGDGVNELIIGEPAGSNWYNGEAFIISTSSLTWASTPFNVRGASPGLVAAGQAYVIGGLLNNSTRGFGMSLAVANNPPNNDLVVACPGCNSYGSLYVLHGGSSSIMASRNLSSSPLQGGSDGYRIDCSYSQDQNLCGDRISTGDINGDGLPDIIWGNTAGLPAEVNQSWANVGYTYVIFGEPWTKEYNPLALSRIQ